MTNPVVDLVGDRTGRIVPVYPQSEKAGVSSWEIGDWVSEALRRARTFADPLPERVALPPEAARLATGPCTRSTPRIPWPTASSPGGAWPSTSCCASR